MKDLPTYLAKYEEGRVLRHIALLSRQFCEPMRELRVDMEADGVQFLRLSENDMPAKFGLSAAEADAFAASWLGFRAAEYDKEQAEIRRLEETKAKALALVESCPALSVRQGNSADVWHVSFGEHEYEPDYDPDEFLATVKQAKGEYDKEQRVKAEVERALSLASHLGIKTERPNQTYYHVEFHADRETWVKDDRLLSSVKQMASRYLNSLLKAHPAIHLVATEEKSEDQKTIWIITRDGHEGECKVAGMAQALKTIEQYIEGEKQVA